MIKARWRLILSRTLTVRSIRVTSSPSPLRIIRTLVGRGGDILLFSGEERNGILATKDRATPGKGETKVSPVWERRLLWAKKSKHLARWKMYYMVTSKCPPCTILLRRKLGPRTAVYAHQQPFIRLGRENTQPVCCMLHTDDTNRGVCCVRECPERDPFPLFLEDVSSNCQQGPLL